MRLSGGRTGCGLSLLALLLAVGCPRPGPSGPAPDGLETYRARSSGPVWGRRLDDGRLQSLFWNLPADDSGEVTGERAALRLLAQDLGVYDVDAGTRVIGTYPLAPRGTVTVFQLVHAGVDVVGAEVRVVRIDDRIRFISARIPPPILLDVEPMVSAAEVSADLGAQLGLAMTPPMTEPRLAVWDSAMVSGHGGTPLLAWRVQVGARPGGTAFVSALNGNLLQLFDAREAFADVFFVRQTDDDLAATEEGGVREHWFAADTGALVTPPMAEPAASNFMDASAAHTDAQAIADFFDATLGITGYDGEGAPIRVLVGYSASCDGCPNAYWMGRDATARDAAHAFGEYFVFSTGFYSGDVFAHEYTHAVLDYLTGADPFDFGESAAVEESLADTFAALYDTASPWVVGDDLALPLQRDLRTPSLNDLGEGCAAQPEHVDERAPLTPAGVPCAPLDAGECTAANGRVCLGGSCFERDGDGGPHCDSAIGSLAAYRLVEGDPMHDVEGIGMEKARVIYATALTLVGPWERFADLRDHVLAACHLWAESGVDVEGLGAPIEGADCGDVINAFHSVGLGEYPDSDRDGWDDRTDNCLMTPNFDQVDSDADRLGDACPFVPEG